MTVAAAAVGTEMRRTRKRRRRIASPILAGVLLCTLAAFSVPGLNRVPIRTVQIHGEIHHVTQEELQELVVPFTSWGWLRMPADRLQRRLEELNWVASARVRREWPLAVSIVITERRPVARWGRDALLDESGEVFDPGDPINRTLPLLQGPEGTEKEMLDRYRAFSARLGARSLALEELRLDLRGAWHVDLRDGPELRLGAGSIDLRLDRAVVALDQLAAERVAEIAYMDLRYPNGFAVSRRKVNTAARKQGGISP